MRACSTRCPCAGRPICSSFQALPPLLRPRYYKLDAEKSKGRPQLRLDECNRPPANPITTIVRNLNSTTEKAPAWALSPPRWQRVAGMVLKTHFFGHWGAYHKQGQRRRTARPLREGFRQARKQNISPRCVSKKGPGGIPTTASAECGKLLREQIIEADGFL